MVHIFKTDNYGYLFKSEEAIIEFVRSNKGVNHLLYSMIEFYRRHPVILFLFDIDTFDGALDYYVSTNPAYWNDIKIIEFPMEQRTE